MSIWSCDDAPAEILAAYERDGYVILSDIFDQASAPSLEQLRAAAADATQLTRTGAWAHRRLVGKQFPPFDKDEHRDYWGVQHLLHPDLPHHEQFAAFYGSPRLLSIAALLMQAENGGASNSSGAEQMQLELFNLLIEPHQHAFALSWHRDDIRPDVSRKEEADKLATPTYGIQWNAALYDDECLFLVPGTHRRARTDDEVAANKAPAPTPVRVEASEGAQKFDGKWDVDPPSAKRVTLKGPFEKLYSAQRVLFV